VRRVAAAFGLVALVATGACDSGPAGPGALTVSVDAPIQIGAVQMKISGAGVTGVRSMTAARVVTRLETDTEQEQSWRVVVFAPAGEAIRLAVDVESTDTSLEALALQVSDLEGTLVGSAGVDVTVER